eukprot:403355123
MSSQQHYTIGEQVGALALVVIISAMAGLILGLLGGYKFKKFWIFPGYTLKPILKNIQIPPLIYMILMGMIARNFFGEAMKPYPATWTVWMRSCILAILLTRGGLSVTFRGKGIIVVLLMLVPQTIDALVVGFLSHGLFKMPLAFSFCLAYSIGTMAGAIIVPGMLNLNDQGYGKAKSIPGTLIASSTFDNIICLILFGIVNAVAMNEATQEVTGITSDISFAIGMLFVQNIAGLCVGVLVGCTAWFFKFFKTFKHLMWAKAIYCTILGVSFVLAGDMSTFTNSKFIACLSFGYTCFRFWGDLKPSKELGTVFWYIQPFLFGTVGAALQFSQIKASDVGYSLLIIVLGCTTRIAGIFVATFRSQYNAREKLLMGVSWISKGTVTATLSGIILAQTKAKGDAYKEFQTYGDQIQTCAVLAIIILSPLSSLLISSLGPKLLTKDLPGQIQQIQSIQIQGNQVGLDDLDKKKDLREQRMIELTNLHNKKLSNKNLGSNTGPNHQYRRINSYDKIHVDANIFQSDIANFDSNNLESQNETQNQDEIQENEQINSQQNNIKQSKVSKQPTRKLRQQKSEQLNRYKADIQNILDIGHI